MELRGAEVRIQPASIDWAGSETPSTGDADLSPAADSLVHSRHVRRPWPVGDSRAETRRTVRVGGSALG